MAEQNVEIQKTKRAGGWFLGLVSFIAIICVGISLLLSKVGLSGQVSSALSTIAQIISYAIVAVISLTYVAKRKSLLVWIFWGVAIALIIVAFILN